MDNILSKLSEPLQISDVDFRVQSISTSGYATILSYKDARVDMNRLDAICGENWQKDYKTIEGKLFCGVGIKINNEWVWRWDVGTESFTEKTKGEASDAFKRACFNWGIGRELYNYPHIIVKLNPDEFTISGDKAKQTYNLKLKEWTWDVNVDQTNVLSLVGKDQNGNIRFQFPRPNSRNTQQPDKQTPPQDLTPEDLINNCTTLKELEDVWFNKITKAEQPVCLAAKNRKKELLIKNQ